MPLTTLLQSVPASVFTGGLLVALAAGPVFAGVGDRDRVTLAAPPAAQSARVPATAVGQPVLREEVAVRYAPPVVWPVGPAAPVSDGFGMRLAPTAGASTNHQGVDFTPGAGAPVLAAAGGTVRETTATDAGGCGVAVTIAHDLLGEAVTTRYCHLATGSITVTTGQHVTAGQQIGAVGSTGVSTGAHLHFEVHPGGAAPVDPIAWLQEHVR